MPIFEEVSVDSTGEIFTAESFLAYFRTTNDLWWPPSAQTSPWVFRGQSDAKWGLIPSASRPAKDTPSQFDILVHRLVDDCERESTIGQMVSRLHRTSDTPPGLTAGDWTVRKTDQLARQWAHEILLRGFVRLARELGLAHFEDPPPSDLISWLESNDQRGDGLGIYHYLAYPRRFDFFVNDSVALGQHHEIPSFLLDWTQDPLAACHFASDGNPGQGGLAVWALDSRLTLQGLDAKTEEDFANHDDFLPIGLYQPSGWQNAYLTSQAGAFTYLRFPFNRWLSDGVFPDLEQIAQEYEEPTNLQRLRNLNYSSVDTAMLDRVEQGEGTAP